ncbi:MAG: TonB-dependent receptor [Acidobacteriota bacterium]
MTAILKKLLTGVMLFTPFLCCVAQTSTARVSGTVKDTSGAAVQAATVTAHNEQTGEDRTTVTTADGTFVFFSLTPTVYSLRAEAAGFGTVALKQLVLRVGQEYVWSPALSVAADKSTVTVNGDDMTALDTSSARIGGNVANREVQQLPINGRQISQLYLLVPGATNAGTGTFDNIHFSGRSVEQNIIRLDGIEATSIIDTSPGNLNGELTSIFRLQQSLEAVQEFRVDTSSYPAEMGTGTGGQISFVTKSGSNHPHGSVFEYVRNDFFDARNFFNRKNVANNTPEFRLNQFGGSLGGALIKDKLFGFASYEGLRQTYAAPYTASTISNYSRSLVPAGSPILSLLAAYPVDPNSLASETGAATPSVQVSAVGKNRIQEDFGDVRFDYHFNDRFQLYARYNRDQGVSRQIQDASLSAFGQVEVPQNAALALNQVWSSRMFNETKIGFNGIKMRVQGIAGPSPNADLSRSRIAVAGLTNVGSLISLSSSFNGVGAPYTGQTYSYIDNFSYVLGRHNMKFGFEIRPLGLYNDQIGGQTYTYTSIPDFINNRNVTIAFYGNLSDKSPFTGLSGNAYVKQAYYIGYAQDEWKVTPSLTLNYGMRYEYYSPLHEKRNKEVVFNMEQGQIYPGYTGDWYHSSLKNFGPRFGFTYSPNWFALKTVLRGGAGLYYGPGQTEDQIQPEANDRISTTFAASSGKIYPIDPVAITAAYDITNPNLGYQPRAYQGKYTVPERVGTYTVSVEQELPAKFELMLAYVGSQGRDLFLRSITNTITGVYQNPATGAGTAIRQFTVGGVATTPTVAGAPGTNRFAEIDYKTSGGVDSYNAFQSTLQRRFASGVSFGMQYTFAKELGTSSGSNEATTAQDPFDLSTEFGRGTFDIRHNMNATVLYDLPWGHGKRYSMSGVTDALLGGFQVGAVFNARSGVPIDVLITRPDLAYVGNTGTVIAGQVFSSPVVTGGVVQTTAVVNVPGGGNTRNIRRPNVVPGVSRYLGSRGQFINPAAFSVPLPGTFGNARRNDTSGPGLEQFDLTLSKAFRVAEGVKAEFKADAYNLLNHPNFGNPGTVRLSQGIPSAPGAANSLQPGVPFPAGNNATAGTAFGALSSTVGNQVGIGTNRQLQLSVRVSF